MANDDPRTMLAEVAASLRAYLEVQAESGAIGIPRKPKGRPEPAPALEPERRALPEETAARGTREAAREPEQAPAVKRAPDRAQPTEPAFVPAALPPFEPAPAPARPAAPAPAPAKPPAAPPRPLPVIQAEVASCTKCVLHETRTNTVFSRGNPAAALCFIGEAPGADEDEQGKPFVGRAGQLLDKMIVAMGLDPEKDVYVCNIIKCRPPGNRKPEPNETEACIPYLHEQLASIQPKAIVLLGNTAVGALLGTKLGITKVRGQWKLYRGSIPVMPTYHPSYLLRPSAQQVEAKKQAWEDLQAVMKQLGLKKK